MLRRRPSPLVLLAAGVSLALAGTAVTPAVANASPPTTSPPATSSSATSSPATSSSAAVHTSAPAAGGGPGALSHFDLARKDCLGTAANRASKVWYTVADGVLSDVYSPTIDNTNVETLQFIVTDGSTFTDLQTRDMTYTVRTTDRSGMACQVTSTAKSGRYRIVTDYITDPARASVVMHTRLVSTARDHKPGDHKPGDHKPGDHGLGDLKLYVRYDATVNGNGGGGTTNGGADSATVVPGGKALVSYDTSTASQAANRDYAVPLFGALRADRPFVNAQSGFVGTPSDGLTQLDADHELGHGAASARDGNVVQVGQLDLRHGGATLALGFGTSQHQALEVAGASASRSYPATRAAYLRTWRTYDHGLIPPPRRLPRSKDQAPEDAKKGDDSHGKDADRIAAAYWLSANVLKASEDKTFPGAVVASLASPWGQAVSAGEAPGGQPVYFGSYREVFSRDLYEAFTGLMATGDRSTARSTVRFLFERQQLADGRMPRNSLINGEKAPDTGGDQLDETAYPILMALQSGLGGDRALWRDHIKKAADFVVAHGPSFGSERWEEQGGYSPSTIAAEIAGLVAAGRIADVNGDHASARVYRATADHFQRSIKGWTVTTTGPYGTGRYFIRLSKNGDPDEAVSYSLGNGSVTADQRAVVDAGFLELTRLGELPADDPDVQRSLAVVDATIKRGTDHGVGWYRYGTSGAGTEDGYGDCYEPDPTTCVPTGRPWPTGNTGSGHLWPVLAGERAEQALQSGHAGTAASLLRTMDAMSSGVGLVPEQAWEDPDLPASPFGTPPETASIGFRNGEPAGSAAPLTWAQAQEARLIQSVAQGAPVEQPALVHRRYAHGAVGDIPVRITSPADGAQVDTATVAVSGTTTPRARVDISSVATDSGGTASVVTTRAGADGRFTATVPTPLGADVLTVASTTGRGTGYARATVVSSFVTGTTALDTTDPTGDDNGPGTYAYPTAGDFHQGAFDITRFQVIDSGDQVVLRTTLADLTPTFGSALGAQMLDIYVHAPGAAGTSTAAASASRNYSIDPADAWSQRIQVQGFADPVWVDAAGNGLGALSVQGSQVGRTITIVAPKAAFGTPTTGWSFSVVLTGQDGGGPDQLRTWAPTPQPYQFGVCASAGQTNPICAVDPGAVPKAMDVIAPAGTSQAAELDPTAPPVVIRGVPVP